MDHEQRRMYCDRLCREYRESGLRLQVFCESRGVARSAMKYRLYESLHRPLSEPAAAGGAQSLVAVGVADGRRCAGALRIRIGEQLTLELDLPVDEQQLTRFLKAAAPL